MTRTCHSQKAALHSIPSSNPARSSSSHPLVLASTYPVDEQGPVGEGGDLVHVEGVEDPLVLGPGDELEGRVGLDVTVDHPAEGQGQVLDGRGEHNAGRVCKKTFIVVKWNKSMPSCYHDNMKDLQVTSSIAGACCGLPMPLVTSQTYVPASSDLIGEMIRAPSGWIVTRPWVRGY